MKIRNFAAISFVVLFLIPANGVTMNPSEDVIDNNPLSPYGYNTPSEGFIDYSGSGDPLSIEYTGIATNTYDDTMTIDSTSAGSTSITLSDEWTRTSDVDVTVDTLSVEITDAVTAGSLDTYHYEMFLGESSYNYDDVAVPDYWTLQKSISSGIVHPKHGVFEMNGDASSGYGGTAGWSFEASWGVGTTITAGDEVYISQQISAPWREITASQIRFKYYVTSASDLVDQVYVFARLEGDETEFHVLESGDTTNTWLQASIDISSSFLSALTVPDSLLLEVGLTTDLSGSQSTARDAFVYIDDIEVDFQVRPFPEQVGLHANGTAVVGGIPGSVYSYVPDDSNRDAYDSDSTGIDLDGYASNGELAFGVYGSDWTTAYAFQAGVQIPLNIPQGAVITSAYLEVEPTAQADNPGMRIYIAGWNTSGLPITNFTSGTPHMEDRYDWIDTSIDWSPPTWTSNVRIRHRSPDLTALIQDVISNSYWSSGDYLCVMLDYMYSSSYQAFSEIKGSSDFSQSELGRLNVEYFVPLTEDMVYPLQYSKDITIDHTKVGSLLTDFPVFIDIYDTDLRTDVQADGDDISFVIDDTPLDFEIESFVQDYNSSHAHLIAWVQVPTLSSSRDTVLTMLYGNPNAISTRSIGVWDGYEMVHHMNDDPTGTQYDSTANNYDGTSFGSLTVADDVDGIINGAIDFDDTEFDMINVGQIDTDDWTQVSVSAWIYHDETEDDSFFSKSEFTTPTAHILTSRISPTNFLSIRILTDGTGGGGGSYDGNFTLTTGTWHYVVWSWSAASATIIAYVNGVATIEAARDGDSIADGPEVFVIGNTDPTNDRYWNGMIDEVRLSNRVLSKAWIDVEYANQVDPSSFYTVGSETSQSTDTSTSLEFTTESTSSLDLVVLMSLEFTGTGTSLDETMVDGTTYYVINGSTTVDWLANILISPPAEAISMEVVVAYPQTEFKPVSVTNPIGTVMVYGTDWTYVAGNLTITAEAADIWGVWKVEFESWNYMDDLQIGIAGESLGATTTIDINQQLKVLATTPWITNAKTGLILFDPDGNEWYTESNTTGSPGTAWDAPSFRYRIPVTIPAAQVDADLTDFPVLLNFVETNLQDTSKVQADGSDILFVSNGEILPHEIERFTQGTGRLVVWVRANLSSSSDNTILMYYGNPVVGSQENPTQVWSNSYEAVWHLDEQVTDEATGALYYDSTDGNYTGIQNGTGLSTGIASYGQAFDGNDYISVNATEGLDPTGDVALSGWFYLSNTFDSTNTTSQLIMTKYLSDDEDMHIVLVGTDYTQSVPFGSLVFKVESSPDQVYVWTEQISWTSGWYHYACYLDADNPTGNQIFINGQDNTNATIIGTSLANDLAFSADWGLGGQYLDGQVVGGEAYFTGSLDEVRISTTLRSTGWLSTEYTSQNPSTQSTFRSIGSEAERISPEHTFTKTIDSTAAAGLWTVSVYYNDTGSSVGSRTGLFERDFIVQHDSSLTLISPGDATGDGVTTKTAGDLLYVEYNLTDDIGGAGITNATVTMNWTVSGSPVDIVLDDYGDGRYGKALNTSDLETIGRWRIIINSYHPYYNNDTTFFDLDLSHATEILYETPPSTPYGDDFTVTITVRDAFNGDPIIGAAITTNGTIVGGVTDNGDGTYSITLETNALSVGTHGYWFTATPSESYLLASSIDIVFTLRDVATSINGVGGDSITTEYNHATSTLITFNDTDHSYAGITEATDSIQAPGSFGVTVTEGTNGVYTVDIDPGTNLPGTYYVNITLSKANYQSQTIYLRVVIEPHDTYVIVNYDSLIPWGTNSSFTVSWYDLDEGNLELSSGMDNITVDTQTFATFSFDLDTDSWIVGEYQLNLTLNPSSTIYRYATILVNITVRAHYTTVYVEGEFTTPYEVSASLTVVYWDQDTDSAIAVSNVNQMSFDPTGQSVQNFDDSSYAITLVTTGWPISTISTTLTITSDSSNLNYEQATFTFDMVIRAHYTTVTISAAPVTPWGFDSQIIVTYWDSDLDAAVPLGSVNQFTITPTGHSVQNFGDASYTITIDTDIWTVSVVSTVLTVTSDGSIYESASISFDITIRAHYTTVTAVVDDATPWGFNTDVTVVFWDIDTDTQVPLTNVSTITYTPSGYGAQTPVGYSPTLVTNSWTVGTVSTGISVICVGSNEFYDTASNSFDITIRAHHTTITAVVDDATPWGFDTSVTITFWDTDTDSQVPVANVTSITYTPSGHGSQSPAGYSPTLTTSTWTVGAVPTGIFVTCLGSNLYYDSASNTFDIIIRAHHTTVTAIADGVSPWGFNTDVTVVFWDEDTNSQVPITNVTSITYTPSGYGAQVLVGYSPTLITDSWDVGAVATGIAVLCVGTNQYNDAASNSFDIVIRPHHTTLTAVVDEDTPWGFNTGVTVVFWDTDFDVAVPLSNVTSITYTPSGYDPQSPAGYSPTLTTSSWTVGVVSTGISIICQNTNKYYDAESFTFEITIRAHHTTVTAVVDDATPWGFNTDVSVLFWDMDTDTQVPLANITTITYSPTGHGVQVLAGYSPTFITDSWDVELVSTGISIVCFNGNEFYNTASNSFDITIRAHHTTITAVPDSSTPWGFNTGLTIVFWDTDTDSAVPIANVSSLTYTPSGYDPQSPVGYSPTLTTDNWDVAIVSTAVSATCITTNKYYDSASNSFDIVIRSHYTSITATADSITPWGFDTGITVVFWDIDTDSEVPIANVSSITYNPSGYSSQSPVGYSPTLTTSTWTVGVVSTGVSVTCVSTNKYYDAATYSFDITIRAHHTTVTAVVDDATPWGFNTDITVVFWDTDTDSAVPLANVTSITYNPSGHGSQVLVGYTPTLITDSWDVSTVSTGISVICVGINQFYDGGSNSFIVTIRAHHTTVTAVVDEDTPWGFDTDVTVIYWDTDTDSHVPLANVSAFTYTPSGHGVQTPFSWTPTLTTSTWTVGAVSTDISISCITTNKYYDAASNSFTITIRAHHTTISAYIRDSTPWGFNTDVTVVFWDTDTDSEVPIANVTTITYTPSGYNAQTPAGYSPTLTTSTWTVGTVSTGLSVLCAGTNEFYDAASNSFDIIIRAHHTTITAVVSQDTPWGFDTSVIVTFWDLDTASQVPLTNVSTITYTPSGHNPQVLVGYAPTLITDSWDVGAVATGISVTCINGNEFYDASSNSFDVTIRAHHTIVTAVVDDDTPWGFNTDVTVTFWDTDLDIEVPLANVSTITYTPSGHSIQTPAGYSPTLTTDSWDVSFVTTDISVACVSTNKYYDSASNTFDITIRAHHTTLTAIPDSSTPWGYNTDVSVVFWDTDTDSAVPIANVSTITYTPSGHGVQTPSGYAPTLATDTWTVGAVATGISVSCFNGNTYYDAASNSFTITIRAHHTSVSVSVTSSTPWGFNTDISVTFWDNDLDIEVPITNVTSITYTPAGHGSQVLVGYSPTLITDSWDVSTVSTGISVICVNSNEFFDTASGTFTVVIRPHLTSLSVTGGLTSPFGNNTPVHVVFWDLDLDIEVDIANVTNLEFNPSGYSIQNSGTYSTLLTTSTWSIGTTSVVLSVTCFNTNKYYDADTHTFSVTITSIGTYLYYEPTDMIIPSGDSFSIILRFDISEPNNPFDGEAIDGILQAEFSAENSTYTFTVILTPLGNGRYNLTIDSSELGGDAYTITISINPTNTTLSSASILISFSYRDARSGLSSPSYPFVITSYQTDIWILLNYTDIDRTTEILGALVTADGISISYEQLPNGIYNVTLFVGSFAKGDHEFNLTASAAQYETKTLTFTLTVRIAYTYAIPTVGALDIPIGNDPIFYVEYRDTDHDLAINSSAPFSITTTWNHSIVWEWVPAQERYRITFLTYDTDSLVQNYIVSFNFSKGENYQFGLFNLTITIRTHNTDFRLVTAVEPTSYNGIINISVYYGDLDNALGINSTFVSHLVWNETMAVSSTLVYGAIEGYYIIQVPAAQFGGLGLQNFTVYFNWTGSVYKYGNLTLIATANIIGEDSKYTLLLSSEPAPYLGNMTYIFSYSALYSGSGITNETGDVFINVVFQGITVDLDQVDIWETNRTGSPGYYTIQFNTTLFGQTGLFNMYIYINWSSSAFPFYTNRTDAVSVRILSRDTIVSIIPPSPTSWGENATFTFSFDDVTGAESVPIANDIALSISLSISDYTLTYNPVTKLFTVSFNTSQSPVGDEPLGLKSFTLTVMWNGAPFYSNRTNIAISITIIERLTVLRYQSPNPTPYQDNVTFVVTWTDVTGAAVLNLTGASVLLYDDVILIPVTYYTVLDNLDGTYDIELNTTYYSTPGTYQLKVVLSTPEFYILDIEATRDFTVNYRVTLLSTDPLTEIPFNSSFVFNLNYQDLQAAGFPVIGNDTSKVHLEIMNGTDWYFTVEWKPAFHYYEVTVHTFNHISRLTIGTTYVLRLNISYSYEAPFYRWDDAYVSFEFRERYSDLSAFSAPAATPYLETVNFTVFYEDQDAGGSTGIIAINTTLAIFKGVTELLNNTHYIATMTANGYWNVLLDSTALDGLDITMITIYASWTGKPYHSAENLDLDITILRRPTIIEIVDPANQAQYLNNITFSFRFVDIETSSAITLDIGYILVYNNGTLLTLGDYVVTNLGSDVYRITINSTVISSSLVTFSPFTIMVDWPDLTPDFYEDYSQGFKITTTNRLGIVSIGQVQITPVDDQMNITFSFIDQGSNFGIENAIIVFSCLDVPGLVLGVDYWIVPGAIAGDYIIQIDSAALGIISPLTQKTFRFSLAIQWDPGVSPYYANATTLQVLGSVRLIQASLSNEAPTPATVPLNDDVSVDVIFTDLDHLLPITGAGFSVLYKSTGLEPVNWSFISLGNGVYTILVDTSDVGTPGTKTLIISIEIYPYQTVSVQVSFQTRYRIGIIDLNNPIPLIYAGDAAYVFVNLSDSDASNAPLTGADLTITWDGADAWNPMGGGIYRILLNASTLLPNIYSLTVTMSLDNFTIQDYTISINVRAITTELTSLEAEIVLDWTDTYEIRVYFNDTIHLDGIEGATVEYIWSGGSGVLNPITGQAGWYNATLDTSLVSATTVIIQISASSTYYNPGSTQITFSIIPLRVEILPVDGAFSISLDRGSNASIIVYLYSVYTGENVSLSIVEYVWQSGSGALTPGALDGHYFVDVATGLVDTGSYTILLSATKLNYLIAPQTFTIIIKQTSVEVVLLEGGLSDETFYWSEQLYIGVNVTAPKLKGTDEYFVTNSTVGWELYSGGQLEWSGFLINGSHITPGLFYFTLNTSDIGTGTFSLKIYVIPGNIAFAQNLTRATISIRNIRTDTFESNTNELIWGGAHWFYFTYHDLDLNVSVDDALVQYQWVGEDGRQNATFFGNGLYGVLLYTQLVRPSLIPQTIQIYYEKDNYESQQDIIYVEISNIPTEVIVYSPDVNQYPDSTTLVVPYGDSIVIDLLYNTTALFEDTPFIGGINGATVSVQTSFPGFADAVLTISVDGIRDGYYFLNFDSTDYIVQSGQYVIVFEFSLDNRTTVSINIAITIINVETDFEFVGVEGNQIYIFYGESTTVSMFYWDTWPTHDSAGVVDATLEGLSSDEAILQILSANASSDAGYYFIDLSSISPLIPVGIDNRTIIITILIQKENYTPQEVILLVTIMPTEMQETLDVSISLGLPIGLILLIALFLYVRILSVPKRLRQMNGQIKALRKGKIPKPIDEAQTRSELVTDLFNDTFIELEITRIAAQLPEFAVDVEVPEMGELLVQLSILTNLSPEELDEFKADISKMKMSEQAAFVKEVIHQEAIRAARRDGKSIDDVIADIQREAAQKISGDESVVDTGLTITADEPVILVADDIEPDIVDREPVSDSVAIIEEIRREEPVVKSDKMSDYEIDELRKELVEKGIPPHEIDTILEQAKTLPRDLIEELLKSLDM